jgi:hypothetical protein
MGGSLLLQESRPSEAALRAARVGVLLPRIRTDIKHLIGGEPADLAVIFDAYAGWLKHSQVPKLLVNAEPAALRKSREMIVDNLTDQLLLSHRRNESK